jgi:PQQ-dependent dehydrogenase (methanol/ethanol family)
MKHAGAAWVLRATLSACSVLASAVFITDPAIAQGVAEATRYSSLEQVNRGNVARLHLVFSFRSGHLGADGGAPLVVGSRLYLLTAFPHALFALDLTREPIQVSWQFEPQPNRQAEGLACCSRTDHGPVFGHGRIYFSTLDGHVIAVDPDTGRVSWDALVADPKNGETLASAPTLYGDRIVIGNAGDDFGARGWIVALDPATGRQLWRYYSTGPDQDVGISQGAQNLGSSTWPATAWQHGGGSVSGLVLYDPQLKLVLHDTGPPAPWNPEVRPGENKWTSGLFARDPETGAVVWFTSLHPHSLYSWAAGTSNVPVERSWQGAQRQLLIHPDADGYLYVLDRHSGQILAADRLLPPDESQTPTKAPENSPATPTPRTNLQVRHVCPAWSGAIGGNAALSDETGLLYIPLSRLCMDLEARDASYLRGTPYIGANMRVSGATGKPHGGLIAWDVATRKAAWRIDEPFPVASDAVATAGGLVFYGTLDGLFKAVDARSGKLMWQYRTSAGIMSQPTTYQGPDGRQYVAVVAGAAGPYGLARQYWIDRRDATAARGLAQAIADVPPPADPSGTLFVFGLP